MTTLESLPATRSNGQLSHNQILLATERCLREQGYDATTIRRIAKSLDCAVGSIYRYFTDKRQLLLTVTQRLIEPVCELLETGGSFEKSVDLYLELAGRDCQPYRLMFWLSCEGMNPANQHAAGPQVPAIVQRIIDAWSTHLDSKPVAQRCWAMAHGAVIAGMNPQDARMAVLQLAEGASRSEPSDSMAQIVSLLKDPPKPLVEHSSKSSEDVVLL